MVSIEMISANAIAGSGIDPLSLKAAPLVRRCLWNMANSGEMVKPGGSKTPPEVGADLQDGAQHAGQDTRADGGSQRN